MSPLMTRRAPGGAPRRAGRSRRARLRVAWLPAPALVSRQRRQRHHATYATTAHPVRRDRRRKLHETRKSWTDARREAVTMPERERICSYEQLFIGCRRWREPPADGVIEVISPHTEDPIAWVPAAAEADVDEAAPAARQAVDAPDSPRRAL